MKLCTFIGLEIHIQLATVSKMFCGCSADIWKAKPNSHVCPVCLGLPGSLPVINKKAVEQVIKMGLALNCQINKEPFFERKNYFYPDLPKGYQISQYRSPLCVDGFVELNQKKIRIHDIHLEEDTAKSIHVQSPQTDEKYSLIDFNKSGIPLMEVVSAPDLSSAQEAVDYCREIQKIAQYLRISEGDLEKGQMRFEVNISLRKLKTQNSKLKDKLPDYRVEIKNLNSFRFVQKAIEYESQRQSEVLQRGLKLAQETRGFDEKRASTFSQREKEYAHDYRYFPEPDIPPLRLSREWIEDIKKRIPELPQQKVERFTKQYGLSKHHCLQLTDKLEIADYFEAVVKEGLEPGEAANIIINQPELRELAPQALVEKVEKQREGMISNAADLSKVVKIVLPQHPQAVSDYKRGKEEALQFLVGQVMRETKGRAEPQLTKKLLKTLLGKS